MCKVSELIEYLQTLPPDCEVEVLEEDTRGYATTTNWVPLDIAEYSDTLTLLDFTKMTVGESHPYYGRIVLELGYR